MGTYDAPQGLEQFDESARRALVRAGLEARGLNHASIGTEHVLLALAADPASVAGYALSLHGLDRRKARLAVLRLVDRGPDAVAAPVGFSPRLREILQTALLDRTAAAAVTDDALLRSLLLHGEGIAAHVLHANGVTADSLATAVTRVRGDAGAQPQHLPSHDAPNGHGRAGRGATG